MDKEKSVSIIIPLYNKEKQIKRCLESLQNQNYGNYKVIVIDDGSSDDSFNKAKKFESDKIKVIHKENGGVSSARNLGIELADTDYIAFVDSDDWVAENYISDFFKSDSNNHSSIAMQSIATLRGFKCDIICNYNDVVVDSNCFKDVFSKYNLLHNGFPFGKLFSLDLINKHKIRFVEELTTHEDHVFVLTYMQYINRVILCSEANYKYVLDENDGSLSKKLYSPETYLRASDELMKSMKNVYEKLDIDTHYFYRAITDFGLTQRLRAILSAYIQDHDKKYRLALLKSEFRINKDAYAMYKSKRKLQDMCVHVALLTPTAILNTLLNSAINILGLKGKEVRLYIK